MITNEPNNWKTWVEEISKKLHGRSKWRLGVILIGIIFAQGRKTVTAWLRAASVGQGYQEFYYFLGSVGHKVQDLAYEVLKIIFQRLLRGADKIVAAIDDSPTRRYGPKIEGAGIHHDGTSKPTDQTLLYGHCWVTMAIIVQHIRWGTIAFPLLSKLYIRACDVLRLPVAYGWVFSILSVSECIVNFFPKIFHFFLTFNAEIWYTCFHRKGSRFAP